LLKSLMHIDLGQEFCRRQQVNFDRVRNLIRVRKLVSSTSIFHCLVAVLLGSVACATVHVETVPSDAEVFLLVRGKEATKLGKTPIDLSIGDLVKTENGDTITIRIEKKGFESIHFGIPNVRFSEISLRKNLNAVAECHVDNNNEIVSLALSAEKLISEQRFKEALAAVKRIQQLDAEVAVAYQLEGTVHFLNGKFQESYDAWKRALKINPNSSAVKQMMRLVESKVGKSDKSGTPAK
jgi:tetratricopeptide (TPR) repeat protein